MALDFYDSFDQYGLQSSDSVTRSLLTSYGWSSVDGSDLEIAAGRFSDSRAVSLLNASVLAAYGNNGTEFAAFAVKFATTATFDSAFCRFLDSGSVQVDFRLDTSGHIVITRNGTTLATSAGILSAGQWYFIEAKVTVDSTTGFAEMKVNGASFVSYTGNTKATSNSYTNQCRLGFIGVGQTILFDDVFIYNSSGGSPNTYTGDKRMYLVTPASAGDSTQFAQNAASWAANTVMALGNQIVDSNGKVQRVTAITSDAKTGGSAPTWATTTGATTTDHNVTWTCIGAEDNWNLVAETGPDGDNSFTSSSTVGQTDRFTGTPIPTTVSGIIAVCPVLYSRKDDAGTRSLRVSLKSGSTVVDNGADLAQNSTYQYYKTIFTIDPNTGIAWVATGVNAANIGYTITA